MVLANSDRVFNQNILTILNVEYFYIDTYKTNFNVQEYRKNRVGTFNAKLLYRIVHLNTFIVVKIIPTMTTIPYDCYPNVCAEWVFMLI